MRGEIGRAGAGEMGNESAQGTLGREKKRRRRETSAYFLRFCGCTCMRFCGYGRNEGLGGKWTYFYEK